MKMTNLIKGLVLFCLGIISILLMSCINNSDDPIIGNGITPVLSNTEYNLDENIIIDVYIGIGNETSKFPSNYKYQIAITNNTEEPFGEGKELIVLFEITSDPLGQYKYTIVNGKAVYTHLEQFIIPPEIFANDSGYFYLGLLEINIESDQLETIAGTMIYKFSYTVVDGKVSISIIK